MFALAGGLAVANIYYLQPLLDVIADEFGLSAAAAGILVAITQVGYLFGLLFLVPLGDMVERRGLICGCLVLAGLAAAICAAAPGVAVLAGALVALGVLSVAAQVMVPLVSTLASDEERGQALGTVMSGLVIGIIGARVVGGGISELIGWRSVYGLAAAAMLLMALMLRRALAPLPPPLADTGYGEALRSVGQLVREEPVLRQRMVLAAIGFGTFSMLWTGLTFLLSDSPFEFNEGVIGLFGLAGVAGALIAPVSGRLVDRGHARLALTGFVVMLSVGWGLLALGRSSVVVLVIGIVVFDFGVTGSQINHQAAIYALRPDARSRVNTAFMSSAFFGMAAGSVLASLLFEAGGWYLVCAVGAGLCLGALALWVATSHLEEGRPRVQPGPAEPGSAAG